MYTRLLAILSISFLNSYATNYAGDFQELGVGARALGMGSAFVAQAGDPFSLYWNPAGSALVEKRSVSFMHAENFGGIVNNEYLGFVLPGEKNSLGIAYYYLGVPGIKLTRLADTLRNLSETNRPIPYDTVTASDHLIYLNYSKGHKQISFGANFKLYYRNLSVIKGFGGGLDVGVITNLPNLSLGFAIRDVVLSPVIWDNGYREQILPRFALGLAPLLPLMKYKSTIKFEWDLIKFIDHGQRFEQNLGMEFSYNESAFMRLGLKDFKPTLGLGIRWKALSLDYAFVHHPDLSASNKISAGVRF